MNEAFRSIPKVDVVLSEPAVRDLPYDREIVKRFVKNRLDAIRGAIASGSLSESPNAAAVALAVAAEARDLMETALVRVINATGVVVFTNLGRAPLAREASFAALEAAGGYTNLEYRLDQGRRGSRQDHIRPVARACFGAQDALVVNNNAAAVLLVLASLARGKEVIVSRGELVEIGGSFRMPDVMALSGAIMREVGTTNKTRLSDYRSALGENTGLIMKVHRSNFSLVGFTDEVGLGELAALAREAGVPFFVDMGSGTPFDLSPWGITDEWTVPSCLALGADVLCFSGDKVLGGPQAGIILGRSDLVERMARHPLHRAVRVDKFTIASLGATLRLLAQGRTDSIPVLRMITEPETEVKRRATRLARLLKLEGARVVPTRAVVGGGSAPTKTFASYGVALRHESANRVHAGLRAARPAVVCRIEEDMLVFDLKAVDRQEIPVLARIIREVTSHAV
ncbi:MAG TPA: L-seryl-tRNA(Sec) selenium transferase [Deltaproteobacteria bacterium]|nr:L-seryl-tRNA(Sec) selenium transferase [Deltaproteobacteria bacterium]HOM28759.1 L-seryl-tRNA(Sec) selenium transferase [Deltaproteobacteria bacterium]HPP81612.1 L-seryl-tRNA(Sec) selenium transferase [Deltaproteobacteria bacterium]